MKIEEKVVKKISQEVPEGDRRRIVIGLVSSLTGDFLEFMASGVFTQQELVTSLKAIKTLITDEEKVANFKALWDEAKKQAEEELALD